MVVLAAIALGTMSRFSGWHVYVEGADLAEKNEISQSRRCACTIYLGGIYAVIIGKGPLGFLVFPLALPFPFIFPFPDAIGRFGPDNSAIKRQPLPSQQPFPFLRKSCHGQAGFKPANLQQSSESSS